MIYQSKKDETVKAELVKSEDKYNTVVLKYVSGSNEGKSISVTTSTLKRWWKKVDEEKSTESILNINPDIVNTPYPEPKEKKYIPKPQSVIDYEAKKVKRYNGDLPTQDDIVEKFGSHLSKINKTYVVFNNGCWVERKNGYINLYANEEVWGALTDKGMTSRANGMKNTKLNFVFKITTMEEYDMVMEVLVND